VIEKDKTDTFNINGTNIVISSGNHIKGTSYEDFEKIVK
jgi:hypothetical protein